MKSTGIWTGFGDSLPGVSRSCESGAGLRSPRYVDKSAPLSPATEGDTGPVPARLSCLPAVMHGDTPVLPVPALHLL